MSPIFVRPVREQLEHDRLIRFLEPKYKQRKFVVGVNLGDEQLAPVKIGTNTFYPDLVLSTASRVTGLVEVETGESVNNLEAMAQWVHFARARVPFHLYVPVQAYDAARRLCDANQARIGEIWTYRATLEGFDLVRMHQDPAAAASKPGSKQGPPQKSAKGPKSSKSAANTKADLPKVATKAAPPKSPAGPSKVSRVKPAASKAAKKKTPPRAKKPANRSNGKKKKK